MARKVVEFRRNQRVVSQGDARLRFIEYNGGIRINDALLSVVLHE